MGIRDRLCSFLTSTLDVNIRQLNVYAAIFLGKIPLYSLIRKFLEPQRKSGCFRKGTSVAFVKSSAMFSQ